MSEESDARRLLGVDADADADAVRAARRRLAKAIHPDVEGGSAEAMRELNEAVAVVLGALERSGPSEGAAARPTVRSHWQSGPTRRFRQSVQTPIDRGIDRDVASFVVEALPVEAFEALLVAATWIGEVIADEPPYQLDVVLTDQLRCWCRLDLVPDAGASTVSVTIARLPDEPSLPDIDDVRDLWVATLNDLGAPD